MNVVRSINKYKYTIVMVLIYVGLCVSVASAQTLTQNEEGTHNGFFYSFWKDSGDATFELLEEGRYRSQWTNSTNNWVGGKGWNPGGPRVVNYEGYYGVDNSQNSYLALYGWTRNPLIEYYVIESYGSYNPATCSGGQDYGSFQSDGATYNVRRCQRVNAPCIDGNNCTFYQYFSVRTPKKGFGDISGTVTVKNHFDYWASQGLNLGTDHYYMVFATEGYQSSGSSDITVSEGSQPTSTPTQTGPTPTNTPTQTGPTPINTPTTSAGGSCSVDYSQNDWGSGATVNVTISNGSSSTINGWTLEWSFPGNQQITNLWNGRYTQSGSSVSVSDVGWNGTIGANGGTAGFGFNISYSGSNQVPSSFTLNGVQCGGDPDPTPTPTPTATATQTPSETVFAVNSGGGAYTASDGTVYAADTGYSGGSTYSNSASIAGTSDDPLYQSERYGNSTYTIPVSNGNYLVTLHFAETYHAQAGLRSFDVLMEGMERISDLDIYAQVGGNAAYLTQTEVTVSDGALNIQFVTNVENAKINAIKVSLAGPTSTPTLGPSPTPAPTSQSGIAVPDGYAAAVGTTGGGNVPPTVKTAGRG